MPGRAAGLARPSDLHKGEGKASAFSPLTDSRVALSVALPFGHTDAERLINFAQKAEALGISDIRPAPPRTMLLLCPSKSAAEAIQAAAAELGFVTDPADPRFHIAACPGKPACASGHLAARGLATEIAKDCGDVLDGSATLHISGCAKGCARSRGSALTLVGSENGAGFVVGGMAKDVPSAYTPPQDTARAFGRIAGLVRQERRTGESTAATLARLGSGRLSEVFGNQ